MRSEPSQKERVWKYLQTHDGLTRLEAMNNSYLRVGNLPARINELRNEGKNIIGDTIVVTHEDGSKTRYERYRAG